MEGMYCEARAKKRSTAKDALIRALFVIGIIFGFAGAFFLGKGLFLLISVACGIGGYFVLPSLKVEYEYVFCDGQIDFDKIMNGEKRKRMARIDMDQVVVCAPINSHALDGYKRQGVKNYDFSSMTPEAKIWGIVTTAGEQISLYRFEPDEVMVSKMKQKSPRKVVEY